MWEKIADLFKISPEYESTTSSGSQKQYLIDHLDLREWYESLPRQKQREIRESKTAVGTGGKEVNLMEKKILSPGDMTQQDFLTGVVKGAANRGDLGFAEEVLPKALSAKGSSPSNEHFMYNSLIKAYYKERNERDNAIEKCIEYCNKDIEMIDEFLRDWDGEPPRIPSFKRLAIIYKKQAKYKKGVEVCNKAIERGLSDNTKSGFEGRKQRLLNKIDD